MEWTAFEVNCAGVNISGFYAIDGDMIEVRAGRYGSKKMRLQGVRPELAVKVLTREIYRAWGAARRRDFARRQAERLMARTGHSALGPSDLNFADLISAHAAKSDALSRYVGPPTATG